MKKIRSENEIGRIRTACRIAADAMAVARDGVKPGITTRAISDRVRIYIEKRGAKAAFLGYNGFPGAICISMNEEVVHGIPGDRIIEEGDLVKIDLGAYHEGFYGDMARTYMVGEVNGDIAALVEATRESFNKGREKAVSGNRVGDIGHAVQTYLEDRGYGVVRALVGHGIGRNLHEDPQVPNFGRPDTGPKLESGMVLAIEPMVNMGDWNVDTLSDEWTVVTRDRKLSAHHENTCVVREGHAEILTVMDGES